MMKFGPARRQTGVQHGVDGRAQLVHRGSEALHARYPSLARTLSLAVLLVVAATACDRSGEEERVRVITGVVVHIDSQALGSIDDFTVRREGRNLEISVIEDTDFAFAPGHLQEHLATSEPVRVEVKRENDRLVALRVEDG